MDTSIDSLSDAESNSSWILVNDGMCDDNSDKTKLIVNNPQEHTEGLKEKDLGSAGSGHESDTSDGISIISEFDSDQERNVQNEETAIPEENGSASGCEDKEGGSEEPGGGSDEELDRNNIIQTIQSQIVEEEEEKGTKHLKIPHFVTISIFGAVFAVSSVFILQLINSPDVNDVATNEYVQNHNNIALPKDTSNKIDKQDFDIVEYCAVKHENDDLFKDYNERKCMKAYKKQIKKKKPNLNQYKKMQKPEVKIEIKKYIMQEGIPIKKNNTEDTDIENYMIKKGKGAKPEFNKEENKKKHKNRLKNSANDPENDRQSEGNVKLRNNKKKFLTAKYILAKEEFLIAKENYLKNKERYLRNMAVTVNEKWQYKKEKQRKPENRNNTKPEKSNKQKYEKDHSPNKIEKRNKWNEKTKKPNLDKNYTKPNKYSRTAEKENSYKYKHLAPRLYKNRRNNSISGEWYHNLFDERTQIRKKERQSEWMFDRAEMRNKRRDKAQWYFQWMTDREQFRYKRGYRVASN